MPPKQRYLRVNEGTHEGVYEIKHIDTVSEAEHGISCPCCAADIPPIIDLILWGFWEDTYTSYFVCTACQKAIEYSYVVVCEVTEVKTA